jgi:hypothetical protein
LFVSIGTTAESPAEDAPAVQKGPEIEARWWRGNLHAHTLWSDGDSYPEQVAAWYKANGYNFLVLTDHNILSRGQKWINPVKNNYTRGRGIETLDRYADEFGKDWVDQRIVDQPFHDWLHSRQGGREQRPEDGEVAVGDKVVRLKPLNEFRALFEEPDRFHLLQGEEITDRPRTIHFNAFNLIEPIEPQGATSETAAETIHYNLEAVRLQSKRLAQPMLVQLNHPNFIWAVTAQDMAGIEALRFFEVFNGGSKLTDEIRSDGRHSGAEHGDDVRPGTERMWDIVLTTRLAAGGRNLLYGTATDDAHEHASAPEPDKKSPGRGWVMVRSTRLTPEKLMAALQAGDFYASSGVELKDVRFDGETLAIEIAAKPGVTYRTEFIGTRRGYDTTSEAVMDQAGRVIAIQYSKEVGMILSTAVGANANYTLRGDELYVRATVTSSLPPARPRRDGEFMQAWVQPVLPFDERQDDSPKSTRD